jgi:branched-chain amino acid transport system substrate-binding protein
MTDFVRRDLAGFYFIIIALSVVFSAQAENSLKIGGLFDLTGGGKVWGSCEKNAVELALKEYEASPTSCGKVSLTVEDTNYEAKTTRNAYSKLVFQDNIKLIIGPTWEVCEVTIPQCEKDDVVCLVPSCHAGIFSHGTKQHSFSLWFNDAGYGEVLGNYIAQKTVRNVVAISAIGAYYDAVTDGFMTHVGHPAKVFRVLPNALDFRSIIAKLPNDTDAIMLLLNSNGQLARFLQQWKEARSSRPLLLSDDEFVVATSAQDLDVRDFPLVISKPKFDLVASRSFVAHYKKQYGEEPRSPSGATAYDATRLLLRCSCKEGSFVEDTSKVLECISKTKEASGASGVLTFDEKHQLVGRDFVVEEHNR